MTLYHFTPNDINNATKPSLHRLAFLTNCVFVYLVNKLVNSCNIFVYLVNNLVNSCNIFVYLVNKLVNSCNVFVYLVNKLV